MKKLLLSLSIIGAITVGAGAITFAADNNGETVNDNTTVNESVTNNEDDTYFRGNPDCPYYEEGRGQNNGEGKGYGFNSQNGNRRGCGGSRSGMMGYRNNL
ncbi:hypothetical protein [uncultured Clostridium sp.]|uniref:hypothetical protein n=1 Tax=uncultured Clostridium sp. TaxID=59620 RepID=UPI00258D355C|nr:hypothetical protein [uncultured Clostridium sp.]